MGFLGRLGPYLPVACAVVEEGEDLMGRFMRTLATAAVFIDVVSKMDDVVVVVLPCSIAIRVVVSSRMVAAREHSKVNLIDVVILPRGSLCPPQVALLIRVANIELVEVLGKRLKTVRLNLYRC